ncbi:prepilin-type N-terminal cleavage/methylation domain-containing protein [Seongchinamella unica]|uniref:Prepilin-type N-terminal cleavage/methylation domain-containing protein n=1 Tax=Seongchinamella unica TaxID=2547392 RepID=A0A4R5LUN8_9GAMM|nr:prepilin-type N-terminal cleavage/methylation domain-containing protein [Seongchinamella unica]TDG15123.1 prepilin-type N-terminal cleavage/methylation domain-containing protein [Seongchinamella unica]
MTALQPSFSRRGQLAFTLVEMMVALAIVGLLMAVAVPGSIRMYESMQYRQAVRDVLTTLADARHRAVDQGRAQDVAFDPGRRQVSFADDIQQLPEGFQLTVTTAEEVNRENLGVIRFYPEGSSTGGDVDIATPTGRGVRISVDWLMGGVSQSSYDAN